MPIVPASAPSSPRRHEESDVPTRSVLWVALALVVGLVLIHGVLWSYLAAVRIVETRSHPAASTSLAPDVRPEAPPEPHVQVDEAAELAAVRDAERARLDGYGWVDRKTGVAHIPIASAIELIAQRGLPAFDSEKPGVETMAGRVRGGIEAPAKTQPEPRP